MKNIVIILLFLFSVSTDSNAQVNTNGDHLIQIGQVDSVYAKKLKENRKFWVRLPAGATANSSTKYPVLYILDGEAQMQSVCAVINQLAPDYMPEMIVVGIGNYQDRTRDLTPSHMEASPNGNDWVKTSGGGKKFVNFIGKDLIPYIDDKYPTTKYRTFVGHSLGGLTVVNTLLNRPELFNNYLAIDPSLWWDDQLMKKELQTTLSKNPLTKNSLFISVAYLPGVEVESVMKQKSGEVKREEHVSELEFSMQTANLEFIKALQSSKYKIDFDWKYYEDEHHGSVPLISMFDGLRSIFSWYKMDKSVLDITNDPNSSAADTKAVILKHYKKLSDKFGYTVHPDEALLNNAGYAFMERAPEKAYEFFNMALECYPHHANPYDSMADYYISQGDLKSALKYVTEAYRISGSDYHKNRVEALSKQ